MKKIALIFGLTLFVFASVGYLYAYEGGTKVITTMTHSETGKVGQGPLLLVPHDQLTASKPFLAFLQRVPKPTLSVAKIREEKPGRSLETKSVIRFQKRGRV